MSAARITVWGEDDCRRVHEATLRVLAETGIDVRYEPALEVFAAAGGRVDGLRVRLDAPAVEKALASAPRTWTVRSRGRDESPRAAQRQHLLRHRLRLPLLPRPRQAARAAGCATPTSRRWPRSARSCPTSISSCRWACPKTRRSRSTTCRPSPRCSPAPASRSWWRPATAASSRPSRTCAPRPARPTAS